MLEITTTMTSLAEHAEVIRVLGRRMIGDVIEIGRRLNECKEHPSMRHGDWLPWLDREFGWGERMAYNFMQVATFAKDKVATIATLDINLGALYMLSAPSTPAEVVDDLIEQAEGGERITIDDVKRAVAEAREQEQTLTTNKLKKMETNYQREVKSLRDELSTAMTPEAVEQAVNDALEPLKKKIERYKAQLEDREKRVKIEYAVPASAIKGAMRHLAASLIINPGDLITAQAAVCELTNQSVKTALADDLANAKTILGWASDFIKQTEKLK